MKRAITVFFAILLGCFAQAQQFPPIGPGSVVPVGPSIGINTAGVPSWVTQIDGKTADIDLNFAGNQFWAGTVLADATSVLSSTRASNETVTDNTGNLTYVTSNVLATSSAGLQAWINRTNLFLQSGDVGNAAWVSLTNGAGTLTKVSNSGIAPDGTNTATLVTISRPTVGPDARFFQSFTGTIATWSGGIYVKAGSAGDIGKVIQQDFFDGSTDKGSIPITLTDSWQRVPQTVTFGAASSANMSFGFIAGVGTQTGTVAFLAWGAQAEAGAFLSPYIPTTSGTATRAADNITAIGNLATLLASSTGSIILKTNVSQASLAGTLIDANGVVLMGKNAGNNCLTAVGATLTSSNTATWTGANDCGLAWDGTGGNINLNGTSTTDAQARTPAAAFHVGSTSGSSAFWNGNITRLIAFVSKVTVPQ